MKKTNNKGFSLVELIIVIAIMAILIGVLAPQYIKYVERSRESADVDLLDSVYKACSVAASDPDITDAPDGVNDTDTTLNGTWGSAVLATLGVSDITAVQNKLKSKKAGGSGAAITIAVDANGNFSVTAGSLSVPNN